MSKPHCWYCARLERVGYKSKNVELPCYFKVGEYDIFSDLDHCIARDYYFPNKYKGVINYLAFENHLKNKDDNYVCTVINKEDNGVLRANHCEELNQEIIRLWKKYNFDSNKNEKIEALEEEVEKLKSIIKFQKYFWNKKH